MAASADHSSATPTRYAVSISASGAPWAARARPVACGALRLGVAGPLRLARMYSMFARTDSRRSSAVTTSWPA